MATLPQWVDISSDSPWIPAEGRNTNQVSSFLALSQAGLCNTQDFTIRRQKRTVFIAAVKGFIVCFFKAMLKIKWICNLHREALSYLS